MQFIDGRLIFSASDLNHALECAHLTELDRLVALGERERPEVTATTELLGRKGEEHEARQLERYRAHYPAIVEFNGRPSGSIAELERADAATVEAMAAGAPLIYQATFFDGSFLGRADFLRRVERPCARWPWSYEVIDSKLALSPKPTYLIQLSNYSEHVARIQGTAPETMYVLLGSGTERPFRYDDYAAYYRGAKARFLERIGSAPNATYPSENSYCTLCPWNASCAARRSSDDHLSLVARIRKDQISKLEAASIGTMTELAGAADDARPPAMQSTTFATLRAQASLQCKQRRTGDYFYELLDGDGGFALLPRPDEGDVFFDMEGDPLYSAERGLEYLFGAYLSREEQYLSFWAKDFAHERSAFEAFIDFLVERRTRFPDLHIYHYASYEATALRRLMGFYGTRETQVNDLLRNEVLVDLYTVTRQALRVSQPSYSIKKLEPFYGMTRSTGVQRGDDSILMFESWLTTGDPAILEDIERYNHDDCRSTHLLLNWLLARRTERERQIGATIPWRERKGTASPEEPERTELAAALLAGMEAPVTLSALRASPDDVRARWLLGNLLDYHDREDRPVWWKLFDRFDNIDRLLDGDHEAIAGLEIDINVQPFLHEGRGRNFVYTYTFPEQQHNLGSDQPYSPHHESPAGLIVALDEEQNRVQIKLSGTIRPNELHALVPGAPLRAGAQRKALARIARQYLDGTLAQNAPATLSLILASAKAFRSPRQIVQPQDIDAASLSGLVAELHDSHVVIQGPPGTGKSTYGAAFIVDLLASGKRVAIVANGHKAIHNLLHKIEERASRAGVAFRGLQKFTGSDSRFVSRLEEPYIEAVSDNAAFSQNHQLAAGTSWLISRDELALSYDYLIVDEAGQMSLADAIACSACARNVVLLGDPLQLAQVSQGAHPPGTDTSALEHLLVGHETIPPDRGVFLDQSFRMAPSICTFISHTVYEDRLHAAPLCSNNAVDSVPLAGSGLFFMPVVHDGNVRSSEEEAQAIVSVIVSLLAGTVSIGGGASRRLNMSDVVVVSPYNAQRKCLRRHLAQAGLGSIAVGTVDKFQGQEAAVVFYSMATSNGATMPRDLEFLFEKNRLNVAISRAQCASVLVCSPDLLYVRASTPAQMSLVNLLCAFAEAATRVAPG